MSSPRTTTPKHVSPPSSSGSPPRSRMLQQPSQRRARSGRNCGELGATERRGGGAGNPDIHQVARFGRPGEVDGRVSPRSSAQERRIGSAHALDQHLLDETDAVHVPLARDPLDDFYQTLDAVVLDLVGYLVWHARDFRAGTRRVDEREGAVVAHLLDHLEGLTEVLVRLAGEADDDV